MFSNSAIHNLLSIGDFQRGAAAPSQDAREVFDPHLLLADHRQIIDSIRQLAGMPEAHWEALYGPAFDSFAAFVQQLPASEAHHHAGPDGMLSHIVKVVHEALKLRRGRLIPSGASAEKLLDCQDLWTYAVATAVLLRDLGKPVTDQRILLYDREGHELGRWSPVTGPFPQEACRYTVEFVTDRRYHFHERLPPLLAHFIIPARGLDWLASDPEVFQAWLAAISGDNDRAGVLGELVRQAAGLSVADNVATTPPIMPSARRIPRSARLLTGLRHLLDQGILPLNRPGAAGWYRDNDVWLVGKRVLDALRDHLTQEGQDDMPSRSDLLMDELQRHGLLLPNGERALWTVTVADGNRSQQHSVLRFSAQTLWPDPHAGPAVFGGTVIPVNPYTKTSAPVQEEKTSPPNGEAVPPQAAPADGEDDGGAADDLGHAFLQWLKDGLASGRLPCNAAIARVHILPQGMFLVSPVIFKDFDRERWAKAQKSFLGMKRHRRTPAGFNIWTCQVNGTHRQSRLRGLLIPGPERAIGLPLPPPNPHLTLEE